MAAAVALQRSFDHSLDSVQDGIQKLCHSSAPVYNTPHVGQQLRTVHNAVDHLRFDDHLLNNSSQWRQKQNEQEIQGHQMGVTNCMAKSRSFLDSYGRNMQKGNVAALQDNQIRENNQWAAQNLDGLKSELAPFATNSHNRVQRFCDWVGVTDRFTGYRNNLSRPRQPLHYDPPWRRGADRPAAHMKFVSESISNRQHSRFNVANCPAPTDCPILSRAKTAPAALRQRHMHNNVTDEYCVVRKYPGISETKYSYPRPTTSANTATATSTGATRSSTPYRINPASDFSVIGRPLLIVPAQIRNSEYTHSYTVPDANQIQMPWQRK